MNKKSVVEGHLVKHLPKIRQIVYRISKDEGVLDDIAQASCLQIIESERLWDGNEDKIKQWMNAVTRNTTLKTVFKNIKEKDRLKLSSEEKIKEKMQDSFISEEQIKWVINQYNDLTEKQRKILNMKYHQEMTITHIGKELGISKQTVSEHIAKAICKLRGKARSQGLLSVLMFWKWNFKMIKDFILLNAVTEIATVLLVLGGFGYSGYNLMSASPTTSFLLDVEEGEVNKENVTDVYALLGLLESDDFEVRDDAQNQLIGMGAKCLTGISTAYSDSSLEVKLIIDKIFEELYQNEQIRDDVVKTINQMVESKILSEKQSEEILRVYHIRTIEKFLDKLGSDRTLIIHEGTFTEEKYLEESCELTELSNLKIIGDGKDPVKFLSGYNGGGVVLIIRKCTDICLVNLEISVINPIKEETKEGVKEKVVRRYGNTKSARIVDCENVVIENSIVRDLKLYLDATKKIFIRNTMIKNFTQIWLQSCKGAVFEKVKIHDNVSSEYLMYIFQTTVEFKDCEVDNLKSNKKTGQKNDEVGRIFWIRRFRGEKVGTDVLFEGGSIKYNPFVKICDMIDDIAFKDVEFRSCPLKYSEKNDVPQTTSDMNKSLIENAKRQLEGESSSDSKGEGSDK